MQRKNSLKNSLRLQNIFSEVSGLPADERSDRLDQLCEGDQRLRDEVRRMIRVDFDNGVRSIADIVRNAITALNEKSLEGHTIGHFQLVRLIGEGGMGRVYLGKDLRLSREVAVKILPPGLSQLPGLVDLFQSEARIAAGLNHRNIVTIHDVGEAEGYHFIVMELIRGQNLRERLRERQRFDLNEVKRISIEVLRALELAHEANIIHCDIKPENVMIDRWDTPKVLDFGLARFGATINQGADSPLRGTADYASPEQKVGAKVDARSDIYSFGVMLHEMAYGCRPGGTVSEEVDVPVELVRIIDHCTAEAPADRYQSATELLAAFQSLRPNQMRWATTRLSARITKRRDAIAAMTIRLLTIFAAGAVILTGLPQFSSRVVSPLPSIKPSNWAHLAPNGNYIVYDKETDSKLSVWVADTRTGFSSQLVEPQSVSYRWPSISNDSRYVFLVQRGETGAPRPNILIKVPLSGGPIEKIAKGVDSPIGLSPDGDKYAYVVEDVERGSSELKISSLVGESQSILSAKFYPDSYTVDGPVWSPDGKSIATTYGSSRNGVHYDVRVIDASTGHDRALTKRQWGHVLGISWLPDNSGLVINGKERGSDLYHQLFYVDPNSGERRILVSPDSSFDYRGRPSVSKESGVILGVYGRTSTSFWFNSAEAPDRFQKYDSQLHMQGYEGISWLGSSKLVFTSRMNGNEHLWVTDLNGNDYQLTNTGSNNRYPHATPDGRYVVFSSDRWGPTHVNRIDIDGGNQIELSRGYNDTDPQVSPDGRWVVFTSEYGNLRTLWRVPIDGGAPVQLTTRWAESPVISPDGRWIACISGDESKLDRSIAIIPFDGGEPVSFVSPKSRGYSRYYRYFRWSPDGTGIDYIALTNGVANIWRQPLRGGEPTQITFFDSLGIESFRWASDGRLMVTRIDNTLSMHLIHWKRATRQSGLSLMLASDRPLDRLADLLYPILYLPSPGGSGSSAASSSFLGTSLSSLW